MPALDASPYQPPRSGNVPDGRRVRLRMPCAFLLAALIFWMDSVTTLEDPASILYVLVLLVVGGAMDRAATIRWSLLCAGLTVASFFVDRGDMGDMRAVLRLAACLAANAVTTVALLRGQAIYCGLRASERRYRTIFDTLAVAIWEHDFTPVQRAIAAVRAAGVTDLGQFVADHPEFVIAARRMVRITDVNDTALRMMGVPDKAGFFSHLSDFLPETDESFAECILAIDARRDNFQAETKIYPLVGPAIDIIVTFSLAGSGPLDRVPGSILNISERKRLEAAMVRTRAELERAQRAEMLGAISATIAHEINQPLTAIHSYADATSRWLQREPPAIAKAGDALAGLIGAVAHARDVVNRTRSLVGTSKAETAPVDLGALIADAVTLMRRESALHQTRIVVEPGEAFVLGDRILLQQVLVNLITNALQALEETPESERQIRLAVRRDASQAFVLIADSGPGWKADAGERLFDPFFTTKSDGMGLGLSICRSILAAHAGDIRLRDAAGGGAEIELVLPLLEREPQAAPYTASAEPIAASR